MPFPADGLEVVSNFQLATGESAAVVQHCRTVAGNADQTDCDEVAAVFVDWYNGSASGNISTLWDEEVIIETVVVSARGVAPQLQTTANINQIGAAASPSLPPETSLVTTWRTSTIGKSYRGRSFWPQPAESKTGADGLWTPTTVTTYTDVFQDLLDMVAAGSSCVLGVYSRLVGVVTEITALQVQPVPHHQRKRNPN